MSLAHATFHQAFGLTIRSCFPLPELLAPATTTAAPDVEVTHGEVPLDLPGAQSSGLRFQATADQLLLRVDGVARFLVSEGRSVVIAPEAGVHEEDVRAFLLGPVLGALLHQRDDLVLHGSAVGV
ncbi:MAG: hypothetical protein RLZZ15_1029, partial [Verrucomicrobiota bacterium]